MKRKGSAVWQGGLKDGKGTVSTESGVLARTPYSFSTRFEGEKGTNPEELIGAAHAGCFSMAFSAVLGEAGFTPDSVETTATVSIEKDDSGFSINRIDLVMAASIPGIDEATFQELAGKAKAGCPVSKLFKAEITLEAKLA
jgi:osmotically inducible protein OsmC